MTITRSYGNWTNRVHPYNSTLESEVAQALDSWDADESTLDKVCEAYREAINAALPEGVQLCGNEFYGPADTESPDLQAIVDAIDFWELADPILDPPRPTPKLDELLSRTSPFSETDGTTLIAAPGHGGGDATPSPGPHELVRWVVRRYGLDGGDRAAVRALTGLTDAELDELGGFSDDRG